MPGPETPLRIGACDCTLLGTLAGFVPDGQRVRAAIERTRPEAIALGIPPEDLEPLGALMADPGLADDLPDLDGHDARFMEVLAGYGETRIAPSPDLAAAHATGLPLHAIDLDDETHTERYTQRVKVRHLVQRARAHKKAMERDFAESPDAYAFAAAWDEALARVRPLAALEVEREAHMADRIRALAHDHARLLAIVPSARFDGIVDRLR